MKHCLLEKTSSIFYLTPKTITEEASAWVECVGCKELGVDDMRLHCLLCNGDGGKWHEAVSECRAGISPNEIVRYRINNESPFVNKDDCLVREWGVCRKCNGKRKWKGLGPIGIGTQEHSCPHCHKDADGNPTGCEPGTESEWRVKEVGG